MDEVVVTPAPVETTDLVGVTPGPVETPSTPAPAPDPTAAPDPGTASDEDYDDDIFSAYFTLDLALGGCIGRQLDDDELLLMECSSSDEALQWRWEEGRLHSKVDDTECMQAGRGRRIEEGIQSLRQGIKLYIKPCSDRRFEFQTFSDTFLFDGGLSGPLFLEARPELCVVSHGQTANIGTDVIKLVDCDVLDPERAQGWEADNPETHDP